MKGVRISRICEAFPGLNKCRHGERSFIQCHPRSAVGVALSSGVAWLRVTLGVSPSSSSIESTAVNSSS